MFNIRHNSPVQLIYFIEEIENQLRHEVEKNMRPRQPDDVKAKWVDVVDQFKYIVYLPKFDIKGWVKNLLSWDKEYYNECEVVLG